MWDFITCPLQFSPVKCMLSNYVFHNSGSTYSYDLLLFIARLSFEFLLTSVSSQNMQIHSDILKVKLNFPRRDFWNGSGWIQWDTEVRKNSVKVEFERVAAAPLTPLIGSKWCFHFINNSGSRTKKGPSRLKSEGGKTQKYKMKLERELLLLISMPEFQSRHKKKRS